MYSYIRKSDIFRTLRQFLVPRRHFYHALHTENEFSVEFVDLGSQNGLGSKGTQITGAYM